MAFSVKQQVKAGADALFVRFQEFKQLLEKQDPVAQLTTIEQNQRQWSVDNALLIELQGKVQATRSRVEGAIPEISIKELKFIKHKLSVAAKTVDLIVSIGDAAKRTFTLPTGQQNSSSSLRSESIDKQDPAYNIPLFIEQLKGIKSNFSPRDYIDNFERLLPYFKRLEEYRSTARASVNPHQKQALLELSQLAYRELDNFCRLQADAEEVPTVEKKSEEMRKRLDQRQLITGGPSQPTKQPITLDPSWFQVGASQADLTSLIAEAAKPHPALEKLLHTVIPLLHDYRTYRDL